MHVGENDFACFPSACYTSCTPHPTPTTLYRPPSVQQQWWWRCTCCTCIMNKLKYLTCKSTLKPSAIGWILGSTIGCSLLTMKVENCCYFCLFLFFFKKLVKVTNFCHLFLVACLCRWMAAINGWCVEVDCRFNDFHEMVWWMRMMKHRDKTLLFVGKVKMFKKKMNKLLVCFFCCSLFLLIVCFLKYAKKHDRKCQKKKTKKKRINKMLFYFRQSSIVFSRKISLLLNKATFLLPQKGNKFHGKSTQKKKDNLPAKHQRIQFQVTSIIFLIVIAASNDAKWEEGR